MKAVVAAFNQEKALVGAFSVITILRMELFADLVWVPRASLQPGVPRVRAPAASPPVEHAGPRRAQHRHHRHQPQHQVHALQQRGTVQGGPTGGTRAGNEGPNEGSQSWRRTLLGPSSG